MNKKLLAVLFVLLLLVFAIMGFLLFSSPKLLLSDRTQKILTETMGVDLWKKGLNDDRRAYFVRVGDGNGTVTIGTPVLCSFAENMDFPSPYPSPKGVG